MKRRSLVLASLVLCACGSPGAAPPPEGPAAPGAPPAPTSRDGITASDCEARGGTVVGDIGDGAIHRPDYRCPATNEPPLGSIEPEPGGPIAVEGSVCCPG